MDALGDGLPAGASAPGGDSDGRLSSQDRGSVFPRYGERDYGITLFELTDEIFGVGASFEAEESLDGSGFVTAAGWYDEDEQKVHTYVICWNHRN